MNVFFDVQGTLVSGGRPRPHAREVFQRLAEMGHHVYLWSSGGNSYAASAATLLDVEDLVLGCFGKAVPLPVSVDFIVDDDPSMTDRYGGYTVSAFAGDPGDRELVGVPEAVKASHLGGRLERADDPVLGDDPTPPADGRAVRGHRLRA